MFTELVFSVWWNECALGYREQFIWCNHAFHWGEWSLVLHCVTQTATAHSLLRSRDTIALSGSDAWVDVDLKLSWRLWPSCDMNKTLLFCIFKKRGGAAWYIPPCRAAHVPKCEAKTFRSPPGGMSYTPPSPCNLMGRETNSIIKLNRFCHFR